MSGLLAGKVWHSNLDPDLKPLAATLADIGDDDGTSIFPSVAFVCWRLGRSDSAVREGLRKLRESGILEVIQAGGGRHKPTEYRMIETKLPFRDPWKKSRNTPVEGEVSESIPSGLDEKPSGGQAETLLPTGTGPVITRDIDPSESRPYLHKPVKQEKKKKGYNRRPARSLNDFPDSPRSTFDVISPSTGEVTGQAEAEFDGHHIGKLSPAGTLTEVWRTMRHDFKATVGKSLGNLYGRPGEILSEALNKYGSNDVVSAFDEWLDHADVRYLKEAKNCLGFIYHIDDWVADTKVVPNESKEDPNAGLALSEAGRKKLDRFKESA